MMRWLCCFVCCIFMYDFGLFEVGCSIVCCIVWGRVDEEWRGNGGDGE